jgi:hypothetical protein
MENESLYAVIGQLEFHAIMTKISKSHCRNFKELRITTYLLDEKHTDIGKLGAACTTHQTVKQYPFVQQADLTGLFGFKPLLLIGQDNYAMIVSKDLIQVEVNAPILSRNKLG